MNVAYWVARRDIIEKGYPQKTQRLWAGQGEPSEEEMQTIALSCQRLQSDMHDWNANPMRKRPTWFYADKNKVYFIAAGEHVKIGHTTGDPAKRMEGLQVGCPFKMKLLGTIPGTREVERALHSRFRSSALGGEWFSLTGRVKELIETMIREQDVNSCLSLSVPVRHKRVLAASQNQ